MCKWSHHGAFNESCVFDGLGKGRATVTAFVRLLARRTSEPAGAPAGEPRVCAAEQCAVSISNSHDPAEPRLRVLVRSLMMGQNEHHGTKWLNTYHLDTTGLSDFRRRHRRRYR